MDFVSKRGTPVAISDTETAAFARTKLRPETEVRYGEKRKSTECRGKFRERDRYAWFGAE